MSDIGKYLRYILKFALLSLWYMYVKVSHVTAKTLLTDA